MKYYINCKKVAHDTAKALLVLCANQKGMDIYDIDDIWANRYSEEGRELIFDLSDCQLEIIADS